MSYSFKPINVGGGGYCTGIDVSSDGLTILTRVDVFGAYIWNGTTGQHDLLTTTTRMPGIVDPGGCIEAVSAPSNSNVIFLWHDDGKLYRSTDHGASFVRIGAADFGAQDGGAANGGIQGSVAYTARLFGKKMAVDPGNPDILYVATVSGGVFRSANATQSVPTFSVVASVPAPSNTNAFSMAFDPRVSQRTGGNSNILYIESNGRGVYQMTAPAGAFSLMAGSPAGAAHMAVSPNGVLYVVDTASLFKWNGSTWTTYANNTGLNQTGINPWSVAVDTNNSASATTERVILCDGGGNLSVTTTSGISGWTGILSATLSSPEIPYLATAGAGSISTGDIGFDSVRNLIVLSEGFGDWTAPGATNANFVWTSQSKGIECMEPQNIIASPNTTSTPTGTAWDLGAFYMPNPDTYSAVQVDTQLTSIIGGWGIDWASSDGGTLVYLLSWPSVGPGSPGDPGGLGFAFDASGTSSDNGATLTPMPMSTQSFSVNLTTSASAAAGTRTLTFGSSIPGWIGRGMAVKNNTHAGTVTGYIRAVTSTTILMDRDIGGVGVSSSDSITVGFPGSGQVKAFQTNAGTPSGNVLHFASLPTDAVHTNMQVYNMSNTGSLSQFSLVLSVSGGDVTLISGSQLSSVASGDVIMFAEAAEGGAIAAASPTNFVVVPSDNASFPYFTTDGGVTWTPINIAGVPRAISATTNGTTTVTADTTNLVVGQTFTDQTQSAFGSNITVNSITDSTHFVASVAASSSTTVPLKTAAWGVAHTQNMKNVAADRVTANKFYLYNTATGLIYVTTNSGTTWSIANAVAASFTGTITGTSLTVSGVTGAIAVGQILTNVTGSPTIVSGSGANWVLNGAVPAVGPVSMTSRVSLAATYGVNGGQNTTLKSVPLNAGHLFLSQANIGFQNVSLLRSSDGGATWSTVPTVSGVQCFGFGKPKVGGGGYPTIFIQGQVSSSFKLWQSDDGEQATPTWNFLGGGSGTANPLNSLDQIVDLDGDKNIYGKVYGAYGFSGWWYGAIDISSSNVFGFSVIHGHARRHTKMIGY